MKNILLENIDVIFGIAEQNNVTVDTGMNLFRLNLIAGEEQQKGAPDRRVPDYEALGKEWAETSEGEQRVMIYEYTAAVNANQNALMKLSEAEDFAGMVALVAPTEE